MDLGQIEGSGLNLYLWAISSRSYFGFSSSAGGSGWALLHHVPSNKQEELSLIWYVWCELSRSWLQRILWLTSSPEGIRHVLHHSMSMSTHMKQPFPNFWELIKPCGLWKHRQSSCRGWNSVCAHTDLSSNGSRNAQETHSNSCITADVPQLRDPGEIKPLWAWWLHNFVGGRPYCPDTWWPGVWAVVCVESSQNWQCLCCAFEALGAPEALLQHRSGVKVTMAVPTINI